MNMDEGKLSISIDFGTTFSGVAYGSSRIAGGKVQQILHWPGSFETFRKIPTCLLYDDQGQVLAWGLEAKNANIVQGGYKCEWWVGPRGAWSPLVQVLTNPFYDIV